MRILVLTNYYPPYLPAIGEDRCRPVVGRLQERGHEVRVLTSMHGVGEPAERGTVHRKLQLHACRGYPALPIRPLFRLERANHAVLRAQLAAFDPDVVHVWNLAGLNAGLLFTLQQSGRPVVFDLADHWLTRHLRTDVWLQWWNGEARRLGARLTARGRRLLGARGRIGGPAPFGPWSELRFDHAYFCSRTLKESALRRGWPVAAAEVIHPGVETTRFARRPDSDRFTRLLYVGPLHEHNDPLTAVRALGRLAAGADDSGLVLDLFGRGEPHYRRLLAQEVAAHRLGSRVNIGEPDVNSLGGLYARYDALLFTSAFEEPFPVVPLEAMAARVPVITTLFGGLGEVVRDGEHALVFRTSDVPELAAQIRRLAADAPLRRRLADTAAREVAAPHDLATVTSRIEAFLQAGVAGA